MKIHMDYLENKLELWEPKLKNYEQEREKLIHREELATEKLLLLKDAKNKEIKDLKEKLTENTKKMN